MSMGRWTRKLALTAHIVSSVGWLGAVGAFLALAGTGLATSDEQMARAAYRAMEPITRFAIVPLALASLLTGLVSSLGTSWGLLRHYWVVIKLIVTVFAAVVLLLQLGPIAHLADAAEQATLASNDLRGARVSLVAHAAGGLLVLLVPTVLGVYKPPGLTPFGQRRQGQQSGWPNA